MIIGLILLIDVPLVIWMQKSTNSSNQIKQEALGIKPLAEMLGLTDRQLNFFSASQKDFSDRINALHHEINDKNKVIVENIFNEDYNKPKVEPLIEKVGKFNVEVEKVRFRYLQNLKSVLNSNQINSEK
jgi:hypothetical protein